VAGRGAGAALRPPFPVGNGTGPSLLAVGGPASTVWVAGVTTWSGLGAIGGSARRLRPAQSSTATATASQTE
jgi:hypothetical protein